jgi:hypothetical protein
MSGRLGPAFPLKAEATTKQVAGAEAAEPVSGRCRQPIAGVQRPGVLGASDL